MNVNTPNALLYLMLVLALEQMACAGPNATLEQIARGISNSIHSTSESAFQFAGLECLADSSKNSISNFGTNLSQANSRFRSLYGNYMKLVKKSIEGNGKCDGSFLAIAKETLHRANKTYQTQYRNHQIAEQIRDSIQSDLIAPTITVNHSRGSDCARQGLRAYASLQNKAQDLLAQFPSLFSKLQEEERKFREYQYENERIASRCAEGTKGSNTVIGITLSPSKTQPQGFTKKGSKISEHPSQKK